MEIKKAESSFVVLAIQHNPSVFFGNFLIESGIIESEKEIDLQNTIATPAFAEINFINQENINLTPEKLIIKGAFGTSPFEKGVKYCKALPYISYKGIGINFTYRISGVSINKFVKDIDAPYIANQLKIVFPHDHGICNLTLKEIKKGEMIEAKFNFDYKVPEPLKLGKIHVDILEEREKNSNKAEQVIHEIFE